MLTFLPVLFFVLVSLAVILLRRVERGAGYSWLTAVGAAILGWIGIFLIRWFRPNPYQRTIWPFINQDTADLIVFRWDEISWSFSFVLVGLVLGVILTAVARLTQRSNPFTWAGNLTITAVALLSILAATPLALVFAWMLFDFLELIIVIPLIQGQDQRRQAVVTFTVRAAGIFLLISAMAVSASDTGQLLFENLSPLGSLLVIAAAGIRLGLLPINLLYQYEIFQRRGISNTLRMTGQAGTLVVLTRLPVNLLEQPWTGAFLYIAAIICVYAAVMWVISRDEIIGRPYWQLSIAGFAISTALYGRPQATLAWSLMLLVSGGVLFLFTLRSKYLKSIILLGAITLSGLPFTPASRAFEGLILLPITFLEILYSLILILLLIGYFKQGFRNVESPENQEPWILPVYTVGLVLILVTGWISVGFGSTQGLSVGVWWLATPVAVIVGGIIMGPKILIRKQAAENRPITRAAAWIGRFGERIYSFFQFRWLYNWFWIIYKSLQSLVNTLTVLLEGDGGVLWAFLLLTLLVTILGLGG